MSPKLMILYTFLKQSGTSGIFLSDPRGVNRGSKSSVSVEDVPGIAGTDWPTVWLAWYWDFLGITGDADGNMSSALRGYWSDSAKYETIDHIDYLLSSS